MDGKENKEEESFVDVWGLDLSKYDTESVEEVDAEVDKEELDDGGASGEAEESEEGKEDVVEKQDAESEEGEEDASTTDTDIPEATEQDTEQEDDSGYGELMQHLVDEDVLLTDEEKDHDFSPDGLKELINETVEAKSKEAIGAFKETLPEEGQQLIEILEKGGTFQDYVNKQSQIDFMKVPVENEQNQQYLVEDYLKLQGFEEEEIQEKLDDYIEAGILQKEAKTAQKKLAAHQVKANKEYEDGLAAQKAAAEEAEKVTAQEFKSEVLETREISGFKVSKKQAQDLYDFITKPIDDEGNTKFKQVDTPENKMLYAYFAMTGFDKNKLSKEIATKQSLSLKKKLSQYKDKQSKPKQGGNYRHNTDAPDNLDFSWHI